MAADFPIALPLTVREAECVAHSLKLDAICSRDRQTADEQVRTRLLGLIKVELDHIDQVRAVQCAGGGD